MQVSYELTEQDFLDALHARRGRRARWFWPLVWTLVILVVLVSALLYMLCPRCVIRLTPLYLVVTVVMAAARLLPPWVARRQFRLQPAALGMRTLECSEQGLINEGATLRSETSWSHYTGWRESDTVFLLNASPQLYIIIPKRAFSGEQLGQLRDMLTRQIGKK